MENTCGPANAWFISKESIVRPEKKILTFQAQLLNTGNGQSQQDRESEGGGVVEEDCEKTGTIERLFTHRCWKETARHEHYKLMC